MWHWQIYAKRTQTARASLSILPRRAPQKNEWQTDTQMCLAKNRTDLSESVHPPAVTLTSIELESMQWDQRLIELFRLEDPSHWNCVLVKAIQIVIKCGPRRCGNVSTHHYHFGHDQAGQPEPGTSKNQICVNLIRLLLSKLNETNFYKFPSPRRQVRIEYNFFFFVLLFPTPPYCRDHKAQSSSGVNGSM